MEHQTAENFDSGQKAEEAAGSMKHGVGKPRWELLPLPDLEDIVKVYTFGAEKYKPNSWRNLDNGMEHHCHAGHLVRLQPQPSTGRT